MEFNRDRPTDLPPSFLQQLIDSAERVSSRPSFTETDKLGTPRAPSVSSSLPRQSSSGYPSPCGSVRGHQVSGSQSGMTHFKPDGYTPSSKPSTPSTTSRRDAPTGVSTVPAAASGGPTDDELMLHYHPASYRPSSVRAGSASTLNCPTVRANFENTPASVFERLITEAGQGLQVSAVQRVPVERPPEVLSNATDIVFLIDATASLLEHAVLGLKGKMCDIVRHMSDTRPDRMLRVGFVAYRDVGIQPAYDYCSLTSDMDMFRSKLLKLEFFTGLKGILKDEPEDVVMGLRLVTHQPWRADTRLIIHIADGPCHGVRYYNAQDIGPDRFRDGQARPGDPTAGELLRELKGADELRISKYLFLHIKRSKTGLMIKRLREEIGDNGTYGEWWIVERDMATVDPNFVAILAGCTPAHFQQAVTTNFRVVPNL